VAGVDYPIAAVDGRGQFAGLVLQIRDCAHVECLEGDEHFVSSGVAASAGTGTEDYFGGGWYFNAGVRRLATATAGNPFLDARGVTAFRFHLADPIPFAGGFSATIEHGGLKAPNTTPGSYRSVAFLYGESPVACADASDGGAAPPPHGNGCACRAAGRAPGPPWAMVLLSVLAVAVRRGQGSRPTGRAGARFPARP
jgi:MYXO-CTERM domain-containing protein